MYRLDRICFDEAFRFSLRAMRRFAEAPGAVCVVAEAAGCELAGFAIAEEEDDLLYLVTLDVAPAKRRMGLAGRMLDWVEWRAVKAQSMVLHVFAGNAEAIAFYERAGFMRVGQETDFYGPGIDALVFRREIKRAADPVR